MTMLDPTLCWNAVERRDATADGRFVYAVRTTGVYCRPSCTARPNRENVAFYANGPEAIAAGFRPCKRCHPDDATLARDLDAQGYAILPGLLDTQTCRDLAALYDRDALFRSRVVMARHGFGQGEYKYFSYPLPAPVQELRTRLYPLLAPIANAWHAAMGVERRFPATQDEFRDECHAAGQTRPTPLLLRYGPGDWNALHQDLYGDCVFPIQVAILLSQPEADFTGGEFLLTTQRPRMQSRASVVPLRQGDAVAFAVNQRPVRGTRGTYRVTMRHGVSEVRNGQRHTLGIIFHDAA